MGLPLSLSLSLILHTPFLYLSSFFSTNNTIFHFLPASPIVPPLYLWLFLSLSLPSPATHLPTHPLPSGSEWMFLRKDLFSTAPAPPPASPVPQAPPHLWLSSPFTFLLPPSSHRSLSTLTATDHIYFECQGLFFFHNLSSFFFFLALSPLAITLSFELLSLLLGLCVRVCGQLFFA